MNYCTKNKSLDDIIVLDGSTINKNQKIQVLFSNLKQKIINIDVTDTNQNDQSYKKHLEIVRSNQLLVTDLGYFCVESFSKIKEKGGLFLSRYFKRASLWHPDGKKIDVNYFLSQEQNNEIDIPVLLGNSKLLCRLICIRLNPEEKIKRDRNLYKKKFKDRRLKKINEECDGWNIFVTNLSEKDYKVGLCYEIYACRWKIELLFKAMKSKCLKIDKADCTTVLGKVMFYCKLLMTVLIFIVRGQKDINISIIKLFKVASGMLLNNIHNIGSWSLYVVRRIQYCIKKFCLTSTYKSKLTSFEKVKKYA